MDQQILFLINRQWTSPGLDWLMAIMSSFSLWGFPLALLIGTVALVGRFRARAMLVVLGLTLAIGDGLAVKNLKKAVGRLRPHQAVAEVRQIDLARARPRLLALGKPLQIKFSRPELAAGNGRSFPSAHTVNNLCAAIVVTAFYRRRGWLMFIPALLVGYSRVYVGSHWPSDVLFSVLLSCAIALPLLALCQRLWAKLAPRFAPILFQRHPRLIDDPS